LNPTNPFAAGEIVLPVNPPDLAIVAVITTQSITSFTVSASGASVVGAPTIAAANTAFTLRYDGATNSWYPENQAFVSLSSFGQNFGLSADAAAARSALGYGTLVPLISGDVTINGITAGAGSGLLNTIFGAGAFSANVNGFSNTAIGNNALGLSSTGIQSTAVGAGALGSQTTGQENTAVGESALVGVVTGSGNIGLGRGAGASITTGSNNTIIGTVNGTAALADTVIVAAGSQERFRVDSSGNMGIGTTSPTARLTVAGNIVASGNITSTGIVLQNFSAAQIADISNAINVTGKASGKIVWDTTNAKIKVATGSAAADTWVDADGTNAVTPS
jgi:hypothetical protein